MKAPDILKKAAQHMEDRAATRDQAQGERSMARTVEAFNAITGHQVSERDGWLFMAVLKAARACTTPTGIADDYEDGAAYFGLAGEAAAGVANDNWTSETAKDIADAMAEDWNALARSHVSPPERNPVPERERHVKIPMEDGTVLHVPVGGYDWIAQDACGAWFAHERRPHTNGECWSPSPGAKFTYLFDSGRNANWRDTLRKVRQ